jgi:peptide/nickel transport system substrate-binding protein
MKKKGIFLLIVPIIISLSLALALGKDKDTIIIAQGVDPTTLDPHNHYETPAFNVCLNIFDTLLQRSAEIKIEPLLATSYKLINDTTWEFNLRKGVKFHNGEVFDAASVKFSLERMIDPKNKLRQGMMGRTIDHVEIIDPYKVHIITKKPYPALDAQLCTVGAMLPPKYVQEKGPTYISTNPVGTGPFKFVRWIKDDQIVLEANEKYWRGAPRIKKAIFRPIPEATTRVAGLQTQELDIIVNIPPHLARLMDWKGRSYVSKVPSVRVIFMAFDNTKGGPVADRRVRRAIAQAVDMEKILKKILEGNALLLGSPLTKNHFGYDPGIKPYPYNLEQAKKLLAEAGLAKGFDFVINSPSGRYLNDKDVAEAVAGDLRKVGINASVRTHEWGTFMTMAYGHNAGPAYLLGWGDTSFDADGTLFALLRTGQVLSSYTNPKLDTLIDRGQSIMDRKTRQHIYSEAGKLIKEDVAWAFAYQQTDIYGVSARVNWKARPDERLVIFDMSFKK